MECMAIQKRIAYVTGSRADFGLMQSVLDAIREKNELSLGLFVAGEHLSDIHGQSGDEVKRAYSEAVVLSAMLEGDTPEHHARYLAALQNALTERFIASRPDAVLVLGDRGEQLITAVTATYLRIPIFHLHGGELSSTIDNAARFTIGRLAHMHLPALESAAARLRATGESPERVRVVGAPALDRIRTMTWPSRNELFARLGLDPARELVFITQHPSTETAEQAGEEMRIVLEAAARLGRQVLVVHPHLDPGGSSMLGALDAFRQRSDFRFVSNLSHPDFLAVARESLVWIGNSSAGVIESAGLGVPVVNVGPRQQGRERGVNVVDAEIDVESIAVAVERVLNDADFRARVAERKSPWGNGRTGETVASLLAEMDLSSLIHKSFDFPV